MPDDEKLYQILAKIERHLAAIAFAVTALAKEKQPGWENPIPLPLPQKPK